MTFTVTIQVSVNLSSGAVMNFQARQSSWYKLEDLFIWSSEEVHTVVASAASEAMKDVHSFESFSESKKMDSWIQISEWCVPPRMQPRAFLVMNYSAREEPGEVTCFKKRRKSVIY